LLRTHWQQWFGPFLRALDPADDPGRRYRYAGELNPHLFPTRTTRDDAPVTTVYFTRGFVSQFGVHVGRWADGASLAEAFRHEPVTTLECHDGLHSPRWAGFTDPALRRVQQLTVHQQWAWGVSAPESTALLEDPHLAGVRHFSLTAVPTDPGELQFVPAAWVDRLTRSALAYRLTGLCLSNIAYNGVAPLCRPGRLRLERLKLGGQLTDDNVRQLGQSGLSDSVSELSLNARLGNVGVATLARSDWRKLTRLNLANNSLSAAVLPMLASAAFVPQLKDLVLSGNLLFTGEERDLARLCSLTDMLDPERLERFDLSDTGLSHVPEFLAERFGDRVVL
jgi:hypothetical protein